MTLAEKLLLSLAEHRPTSPGRHVWTHTDAAAGWTAALTIDKADALSCQFGEVTLTRTTQATWDGPMLKAKSDAIAAKVTGLMEPLRLIEVDELRREALLRSVAPTARSEKRFHYELRLMGTGIATLRRFQAELDRTAKREPIPFSLTHETLAKFVDDVTDCLA